MTYDVQKSDSVDCDEKPLLTRLSRLELGAVTSGAFGGSGLVEKNIFSIDHAHFLVTGFAAHVAMHALQREPGEFVVIEKCRLPLGAVMTVDAGGDAGLCELFPMRIFVAILTLVRSRLEVYVEKPGLKIRRLVAINAGRRLMCTEEGEVRLRMIEAG